MDTKELLEAWEAGINSLDAYLAWQRILLNNTKTFAKAGAFFLGWKQ